MWQRHSEPFTNCQLDLGPDLKHSYHFKYGLHFMQEIHLMHKLSYDRNMVQLYGACLDSTCPMLVLEYMEGGDLQSCILQDCYPNSIGAFRWYKKGGRVALDVAKGLVFLHEQKVRLRHEFLCILIGM